MSLFNKSEDALDRAVAEVHGEEIDPVVAEQAAARVWERLSAQASGTAELHASAEPVAEPVAVSAGSLRSCEDFQSLIPAYLRGELSPARALLVEDHTRSCIPCRRALREAKEGHREATRPAAKAVPNPRMRQAWMGLAALLVIGLGLGVFFVLQDVFAGGARMARVESIAGNLYLLDGEDSEPIDAGTWVAEGDEIRTAKGSTALVRMADGSLIEMSDRAGMWLDAGRKGNTIHLDRGRVIVQAAKQRKSQLFVATRDAMVSVTGTIFSVNHGTKGSRVSVIEGEVRVRQAKLDSILHPGDQVATHASVSAVPVRQEIAWSRNAKKYEELLAALTAAGQDIDAQVERPGLRYSTRLLDLAPEGTRVWIGLPNLGRNLQETQRILDQKIAENGTLQQWWRETIGSNNKDEKFHQMIDKLGALGQHLGGEVAIALGPGYGEGGEGEDEDHGEPVIMAEVTNPAAFRAVLEQEIAAHDDGHQGLRIIEDPADATGETEGAWLWIGQGLFVATPSGDELRKVAALASGGANPFAGSRFHDRIAEEYRDGANWLFAADLATLVGEDASHGDEHDVAEKMGVLDLDHFILNRREIDNKAETRASLTFSQARRGVASWLAAPAPMGGLSFFSPETNLAGAFVVKQPVALLDDLLAINPEIAAELAKLQNEHGFDLRNDLAAPLGGEVAIGVDGPLLPTPSWKLVVEVYDPARLQQTIERVADRLNDELRKNGKPTVEVTEQRSGGRTWYTFGTKQPKHEVHYIFEDGYLVAAPSRALLERALQLRDSGVTLATAPKFRDLLGPDGQVNVSAFFYQNLKPLADAAADMLPKGALGPADRQGQMATFLLGQGPTLVYAYAHEDRILFASTNESPLGLNLQTLAGFGGVLGMMNGHVPDAEHFEAE